MTGRGRELLPDTFQRAGRKVVLLTLREAMAVDIALAGTQPWVPPEVTEDLRRAKAVLRNQVSWLLLQGEPLGVVVD